MLIIFVGNNKWHALHRNIRRWKNLCVHLRLNFALNIVLLGVICTIFDARGKGQVVSRVLFEGGGWILFLFGEIFKGRWGGKWRQKMNGFEVCVCCEIRHIVSCWLSRPVHLSTIGPLYFLVPLPPHSLIIYHSSSSSYYTLFNFEYESL